MSNVLDKPIVLSLNASWMPIGQRSVREAILAMNATSKDGKDRAAVAVDVQYDLNEDGSWALDKPPIAMIPTPWHEWIKLPIRDYDEVINTARMVVRVPTVVIAVHYHKMPKKSFRPSKRTIYHRDGGTCQYSGRKLSYNEATLDHVQPRSKGGKDTFENLVLSAPEVNHKKGNKSNKEAGLTLARVPKALPSVPAVATITEARHNDWHWFLVNKA